RRIAGNCRRVAVWRRRQRQPHGTRFARWKASMAHAHRQRLQCSGDIPARWAAAAAHRRRRYVVRIHFVLRAEDFMKVHNSAGMRRWAIIGAASLAFAAGSLVSLPSSAQQAPARGGRGGGAQGTPVLGPNGEVWGFTDKGLNPNSLWPIQDTHRTTPPSITPGETVSIPAPSDA